MWRQIAWLGLVFAISSCSGRPNVRTAEVYSHDQLKIYRNGTCLGEVHLLNVPPSDPTENRSSGARVTSPGFYRGIVFVSAVDKNEKWIFPEKGLVFDKNRIRIADNRPTPLSELLNQWDQFESDSEFPQPKECFDVHFSKDSSCLVFAVNGLPNSSVWEFSFASGGIRKISDTYKRLDSFDFIGTKAAFLAAKNFLQTSNDPQVRRVVGRLDMGKARSSDLVKPGDRHEKEGPIGVPYYRFCFRYSGSGFNAWINPADFFVAVEARSGRVLRAGEDFHK